MKTLSKFGIICFAVFVFVIAGCTKNKTPETDHGNMAAVGKEEQEIYYCPMHPEVQSPHPGACPICHMTLVKKHKTGENIPGEVVLSGSQGITANVTTAKVTVQSLEKEIVAYSVIDFADDGRKTISAKFNGRVEKLFVASNGQTVQKGTPLFTAYSADIYQTMAEYASLKRDAAGNSKLADAGKRKLLLAGLTETQIRELETKKEVDPVFTVYSPFTGIVVEKKIQEGSYFTEGTALYEVVDVSRLWNIAEVSEADAALLHSGMTASVTIPALLNKTFESRITLLYPAISKQNRTVKVRTDIVHADINLKPQMYGQTRFKIKMGQGILIPENAILFTGKRQLVYVKSGEGKFRAREITVGGRIGDSYQITAGLSAGEEIAASGGYLLDSESQLKSGGAAAEPMPGMKMNSGNEQGNAQPAEKPNPQPARKSNPASSDIHAGMDMKETAKAVMLDKNDPRLKKLGVFNTVCPVLGEEISSERTNVLYKGKIYGFCCKGCDKKFIADPERYLKNLSKDGKTFIGKKKEL